MSSLLRCEACRHDLVAHEDGRCRERTCRCTTGRLAELEAQIERVRKPERSADRDGAFPSPNATPRERSGAMLGRRVRELRVEHGWSQAKLATISGVERTTLQRIEACRRLDPGFSIIVNLARALGAPLESFLAEEPVALA